MKDYSIEPKIRFCDYTFDDEIVILAEELSCQHNFRSNYAGELIIGLKGLSPSSFIGMITELDADVVDALIYELIKENKNR